MRSCALGLLATGAILAGALMLAPAAEARGAAANPSLEVTFAVSGTITVTLADGTTPVGSASGPPTVIPAGYYTVLLSGPAGCNELPVFQLKGPGESIASNLSDGEVTSGGFNAYFLPNSTYAWTDSANPSVVYTFTTSSTVEGAPPSTAAPASSGAPTVVSSQDLVGSATVAFRGTLSGAVSAAGKLTLAFKGRSVTSLMPGRYTIAVDDRSATGGFMLGKVGGRAMSLTGAAFVGRHSASVDLTAGRWLLTTRANAKHPYTIVVG